jgi:hypothetical protein
MVLEHQAAACYCLPGRPGTIVITSGALHRLTERQLSAALAHEQAHLDGRHHPLVAFAHALQRSVPGIRLLSYAEREPQRLVELIADDASARRNGAAAVASALAVFGLGQVPAAALGIGPSDQPAAMARVAPLIAPSRRLGRRGTVLGAAGAALIITVPVATGIAAALLLLRTPSMDNERPMTVQSTVRTAPQLYYYYAK